MRYIGRSFTSTLVQVDPDRNSFVNIKSFGAAGLDRFFTARVAGLGGASDTINITDIQDFSSYEEEYFKIDQELYAFFYRETSLPGAEFSGKFSSAGITSIGGIVAPGAGSKQLRYFVYPYNPTDGIFSPYRLEFSLDDVSLDPKTQFNEDKYARITFNRANSDWLPVIFRQWGTAPVKFLGVLSNNILGPGSSVSFNDRGTTQIPSWDEADESSIPEFLSNVLSFAGSGISAHTIVQKRRLKIIANSFTGNLECVDAETPGRVFSEVADPTIKIKFKFDDTSAIQTAIDYASNTKLKDVFIPSGTYSIRNLKLYSTTQAEKYNGIILRGVGESSVLKALPSVVNPPGQYGMVGVLGLGPSQRASSIAITNIVFDGNKSSTYPVLTPENDVYGVGNKYNDFIALEYADSVRISNCSFFNGAGSAIYALNSEKINITDNRVYKLSKPYELNISPVKIRETSKAIIQGNLFENCSGPLDFMGIESSTINNNIISNCGDTGIQLNASDTWSAQGNLAYNQSGSIVKSVDMYNNEYSRVSLDIKRGVVMTPTYFTVSDGSLPVNIEKDSIVARVYPLKSDYTYNTSGASMYLQVVETTPQLEVGIFALTAPITSVASAIGGSNQGKNILGTSAYNLLDTSNGRYGYGYSIKATVSVGNFAIKRIAWAGPEAPNKVKIFLTNTSNILSLFYLGGGGGGDLIRTAGISVSGSDLQNWPDGVAITIDSIDQENGAVVVDVAGPLSAVSSLFTNATDIYNTPSGKLSAIKTNYFIADGNIYVSE